MKIGHIKYLHTLWAKKIKNKAGWKCEKCGSLKKVSAAHIQAKNHRETSFGAWINGKYDLCGMCLCTKCHNDYDDGCPIPVVETIRDVIGIKRYLDIGMVPKVDASKQKYEEIKEWIKNA